MVKKIFFVLWLCFLTLTSLLGQGLFVPNKGQWEQNFEYYLKLSNGAIHFDKNGPLITLNDPQLLKYLEATHHGPSRVAAFGPKLKKPELIKQHSYQMKFLNANASATIEGIDEKSFKHNYFIGNDKKHWKSGVSVFGGIVYQNLYPKIDAKYFDFEGTFKYEFRCAPGSDPNQIKINYLYTEGLELSRGKLIVKTSVGDITELEPFAYQIVNGYTRQIACSYRIDGSIVSYELGDYDTSLPLIIDPTVVFSTFTGAISDNWGFTATFDLDGNFYAGGIVFGTGYPTTTGAFQTNWGGGGGLNNTVTDVVITKFNDQGTNLIYSTFLGGGSSEQPHSLVVNSNNELIVFGITGSANFPVTQNAAQTTFGGGTNLVIQNYSFAQGTDMFVTRFNANGSNIIGSTFLGGSSNDGFNAELIRNYGDYARGEVIVDSANNIYIGSMTFSNNFPLVGTNNFGFFGNQDAVAIKLNANLSQILWSTYMGGSAADAAYSIKQRGNFVYIAGGTRSNAIPRHTGAYQSNFGGQTDGFIARFDANTGEWQRGTYYGTNQFDQIYFTDFDKTGQFYGFAQTTGNIVKTQSKFGQSNRAQVIFKMNTELSQQLWVTTFGSAPGEVNISPSAFNVDDCYNIMLSGWGGRVNRAINGPTINNGWVYNLPTTPDAIKINSDSSEFYFMMLGADGNQLKFGTYYGGSSDEHVDGGTSRFSPQGIIYQAICAACLGGTFPTTPGVYSNTRNSNNCNYAGLKIDFENSVTAEADIDFTLEVDSLCNFFNVSFSNSSSNAQSFFWDFGNGQTSTQFEPTSSFQGPATFTVTMIAHDTLCDLYDTTFIQVVVPESAPMQLDLATFYKSCDSEFKLKIENKTLNAHIFEWSLGDGTFFSGFEPPEHFYPAEGVYTGYMVAYDTICIDQDTLFFTVSFNDTVVMPEILSVSPRCPEGSFDVILSNISDNYLYTWNFGNGIVRAGRRPNYAYPSSGEFTIRLNIRDTFCNREYNYDIPVTVDFTGDFYYIPNTFTPNNDGKNDIFILAGNECLENAKFEIFNRWGQRIFYTEKPFEEFWDGKYNGKDAAQGVYVYVFSHYRGKKNGIIHLFR